MAGAFGIQIQGIQELQKDNQLLIAAIRPTSGLGDAVKVSGQELARYMVSITHVDTSALRSSEIMDFSGTGDEAQAVVHIADGTLNPRTGQSPANYGPYENARGGSHAFMERTVTERGDSAIELGLSAMMRRMP